MEKNSERSAKVFGDRLVVGDGPVYPNRKLVVLTIATCKSEAMANIGPNTFVACFKGMKYNIQAIL